MGGRFAPGEEPVFAAKHDRPQRLLRPVVVDLEPAVFGVVSTPERKYISGPE
jgi:hypothetical protein